MERGLRLAAGQVADEARAIAELGRQLYERLGVLLGHVDLVSKRLNSLVDAHNNVVGSLQRRILPTARRFPQLGRSTRPTSCRRQTRSTCTPAACRRPNCRSEMVSR